ncbi:MAG: hypothetical protein L0312_20080 [Acidobacteria bacterium]|nr:hypothetical protein [Acidobacteriota bacterium]
MTFEQGALDCLVAAKQALERAEATYGECRSAKELSLDSGPLFGALDNVDTAKKELIDFMALATRR